MSQTIHRITIERILAIQKLEVGKFILITDNSRNRGKVRNAIYKAQTIGYDRYPDLKLSALNVYRIFEHQRKLYIARIK